MNLSYSKEINSALKDLLDIKSTVLMGEDICDPLGGCFKVTKGLSSLYPEQVMNMPIAEAGTLGMAIGMSLNHVRPIVEVMFSDFLTLCADQIINHASVFKDIFNKDIPIILRTVSGPGNGYGATHSKSMEHLFYHIPNVDIYYPSHYHNVYRILKKAYRSNNLSLFIEDKRLYSKFLFKKDDLFKIEEDVDNDITYLTYTDKPDLTIVTYGGCLIEVLESVKFLKDNYNFLCNIMVVSNMKLKINNLLKDKKYLFIGDNINFKDSILEPENIIYPKEENVSDNVLFEKEHFFTTHKLMRYLKL